MDDGDETSPVGAAAHILVIDDDRKITDALRRDLVYQGYRVDVAHSGADGLELARRWAPDVVILDILMPGLDGLEVCRRLRAGGDVPILLLTARDRIEDRVEGLADDLARTMQIRHVPPPGRLVVTLPPTNVFGAPDTFAEVADIRGGQVVACSATLGGQTLPFLVQALAAARRGQSMARVVEPEENRLHLYSVPLRSGGRVVGVIEVARALAADERLLERLRLALGFIGGPVRAAALRGRRLARTAHAAHHHPCQRRRPGLGRCRRPRRARVCPGRSRRRGRADGGLVDRLLTLARADAGQRLTLRPTPLRPLLEEAHRQARLLAPAQRVALARADEVTVAADPDALKQLLLILVENVLKYTSTGVVTLALSRDGDEARFSVADTGIGIA